MATIIHERALAGEEPEVDHRPLTVVEVGTLGRTHGARAALVLLFDDVGRVLGTSWGRTVPDGRGVAATLDEIVTALIAGRIIDPFNEVHAARLRDERAEGGSDD